MPVDPVRDAAIDVLLRVFERGAYLSVSLDRTLRRKTGLSPQGKRFLTQLVYGTARHRLLCEHLLTPLLHQPFEKLPAAIQMILRMGAYQTLFCQTVTFPAMVHTSVDLAKKRGHAGTARLVNAVLKRVPQTLDAIELPEAPVDRMSIRYSLSPWLVKRWVEEYGVAEAEAICEASDSEAPRCLRVNTTRTSLEELRHTLEKGGCITEPHALVPNALVVLDGHLSLRSKAFRDGHYYIQDPASMLSPELLQPRPGDRVLDLCAAPGGKATHLAELSEGKAMIVAVDISPRKTERIIENAERLQLHGLHVTVADGNAVPFAPETFDRVLLDAPCTGLGTLRRKPELKWRIAPEDPQRLAQEQRRLLRSAIVHCKIGGVLVYSLCTFTPEETAGVIGPILGEGTLEPEDGPAWLNPWKIDTGTYRILPRKNQLDGYFLTRFRKRS